MSDRFLIMIEKPVDTCSAIAKVYLFEETLLLNSQARFKVYKN